MNKEHFLNREHSGEYTEVEFDTYITNKGKEEVLDIVTNIHYYEAGEGEPLILVHGIGQNSYTWRNIFYQLAKDFHVYAIDLPGHGFSGKPEISYTVEEFALAIEAFMNVKKIVSASFCALARRWSMCWILPYTTLTAQKSWCSYRP
jgi:alpha-beta hydrolase superfamily lysophospholipase